MFADTLSKLINLQLTEPIFGTLPDVHVDSSTHIPILPVGISNINASDDSNVQNENVDHNEISLKDLRFIYLI